MILQFLFGVPSFSNALCHGDINTFLLFEHVISGLLEDTVNKRAQTNRVHPGLLSLDDVGIREVLPVIRC